MTTRLNPYLTFDGTAREAMEFYREVFGGTLNLSTFDEFTPSEAGPAPEGVMHAHLETDSGMTLMASDMPPGMGAAPEPAGMSVSLSGADASELRGYGDKLSAGGQVTMPLEKQVWGDEFGICSDRFGIPWMLNITSPENAAQGG